MTIQSTSILRTLVLAGVLVTPAVADAQSKPTGAAPTTAAVTNVRPW
jgi:hypothetical protein